MVAAARERNALPQPGVDRPRDDAAKRRQVMVDLHSKCALAGAWCAGVIVLGACAIVAGVTRTRASGEGWLIPCLLPPTLTLRLGRQNPPVEPLLQLVNRPSKD